MVALTLTIALITIVLQYEKVVVYCMLVVLFAHFRIFHVFTPYTSTDWISIVYSIGLSYQVKLCHIRCSMSCAFILSSIFYYASNAVVDSIDDPDQGSSIRSFGSEHTWNLQWSFCYPWYNDTLSIFSHFLDGTYYCWDFFYRISFQSYHRMCELCCIVYCHMHCISLW